jgi:hypothetical protein
MNLSRLFVVGILLAPCLFGVNADAFKIFRNQEGRYGLNADGKPVLPPRYHGITKLSECCVIVESDSGWWAINLDSRDSIKTFQVDNGPDRFEEGLARYIADGKIGFYDRHVHIRIPARFDFASSFNQGYAAFCKGCKEYFIGELSFRSDTGWGVIDKRGIPIVEPKYTKAITIEKGMFILMAGPDTVKIPAPIMKVRRH